MTVQNDAICTPFREMPCLKQSGNTAQLIGIAITIVFAVGLLLAATGHLPAPIPFNATLYSSIILGAAGLTFVGLALRMIFKEKVVKENPISETSSSESSQTTSSELLDANLPRVDFDCDQAKLHMNLTFVFTERAKEILKESNLLTDPDSTKWRDNIPFVLLIPKQSHTKRDFQVVAVPMSSIHSKKTPIEFSFRNETYRVHLTDAQRHMIERSTPTHTFVKESLEPILFTK